MPLVKLEAKANDGGTYSVPVSFADENGSVIIPNSVVWSLRNGDGQIINDRDQVVMTPVSSGHIVVYGDDILFADGPLRYLTVEAVYDSTLGTNLPAKGECRFKIADFKGVPNSG